MKKFSILLAAALIAFAWGCDVFKDDPASPPALDKVYEIEIIVAPDASLLGWKAEVQYLGVGDGYMGRYNINAQDRTVEWTSRYGPSQIVQVLVSDAGGNEVATFLIDNRKVVRTRDGVSVTLNEQGWVEFSESIYHVQLDCRL